MKSIVIHGGIGEFEGGEAPLEQYRKALHEVVADAHSLLKAKDARQAVLHAIRALEDNEIFNAGTGSRIQADGEIRMSAALMDGMARQFSGVINMQYVKNPIDVAAKLAVEKSKVLAGAEATAFARAAGFDSHYPYTAHRLREFRGMQQGKTGTVGAVAVDDVGKIFAATSTGGVGGETPGRVSDSATVAGNYANEKMGVSMTGIGEQIVNHASAARIGVRVEDGLSLAGAMENTVQEARELDYLYGCIAVDREGAIVTAQTRGTLLWASHDEVEIKTF